MPEVRLHFCSNGEKISVDCPVTKQAVIRLIIKKANTHSSVVTKLIGGHNQKFSNK